jgi:MFS transporter, ACS family, hexuronate transporter
MTSHQSPITNHQSPWKWWVCGTLLLATLLNYMDRQAFSETSTRLKADYNLDDARYGTIEKGFSYAFAFGSVLFGWLADRFGPRRLYPIVLAGWSLAGVATTFAATPQLVSFLEGPSDEPGTGSYRWFLICRTALGLFEAGHWPCALITARQILTAAERPFGNGLLQSGASAGAVLTPLYVLLIYSFGGGWQIVFWSIGLVGLLWVPLWFALVRRGDLDRPPPPAADGVTDPRGWTFASRFFVLAVVVTVLGVCWQFIRAWLPKYLKESLGYSDLGSAWTVAGYYIAADLGCILAGYLVKRMADRGRAVHAGRVLVYAGWCGLTALAVLIPFVGDNPLLLAPLLMLVGAGILGLHPVYYALAQELPARRMGVLSGVLAALTWFTVGTIQGEIGAHIKATGDYTPGFVLAGLAPLAGLVALLVLWRSR